MNKFSEFGAIAVIPKEYKVIQSFKDLVITRISPPSLGSCLAP